MSDFSPPPLPPDPPEPPPPAPAPPGGIPWDNRDRLGLATALIETIKLVLLDSVAFYRRMPPSGGLPGPLAFGLILGYFGFAVSMIYNFMMNASGGLLAGLGRGGGNFNRYSHLIGTGAGFVGALVLGPVFLVIALFLGAGITHLCLMLLGGAKRDYETTFRVTCFAQAAAVFAVIPFCGGLVQAVYQIVLAIIGISEAHGVSRWTAAGAVLLPIVLVCCCCGAGVFMLAGGIASSLNR